jgi:D-serine dehydratase
MKQSNQQCGLDATFRGIPPGSKPSSLAEIGSLGWQPARGDMPLPVLTLDEAAYEANCEAIFAHLAVAGAVIAPHAKTPMCPEIALDLLRRGAWGATVANIQQAAVMLEAGLPRLILGNEIGGRRAGQHLGHLLAIHPGAELQAFADSPEAVATLAMAAQEAGRRLGVLVEVGGGRAGARGLDGAHAVIEAVRAEASLFLGGVATYEGAVASADAAATAAAMDSLFALAAEAARLVRQAEPARPLLLSAGGSAFFDLVLDALGPVARADGNMTLVLRSGAIFFHDHGVYERGLRAMDTRGGFGGRASACFRPALRLWAEVLSRPEPGLAICGFGMRDVSFDQDLPRPLAAFRDGAPLPLREARVTRLNDQHAFLALAADSTLAVGDILELGISHPCTSLDRWRVFFGLDRHGAVRTAYQTRFG